MKPETKNKINAILVKVLVFGILVALFYFWFASRLNELVDASKDNVAKQHTIIREVKVKK